jgi:hypothetical protein
MQKFRVTVEFEVDADTAQEAALLTYQRLANQYPPTSFAVADGITAPIMIELERSEADEFAATDHTADPGNW